MSVSEPVGRNGSHGDLYRGHESYRSTKRRLESPVAENDKYTKTFGKLLLKGKFFVIRS